MSVAQVYNGMLDNLAGFPPSLLPLWCTAMTVYYSSFYVVCVCVCVCVCVHVHVSVVCTCTGEGVVHVDA